MFMTNLYFFYFAERARFELANQFCRSHAFQACLFSHSSISPFLWAHSCELCLNFALFGYKNIFFFLYSHSFCAKSFDLCAFFAVLNALLWVNTLKYTFCVVVCDVFCLLLAHIIYLCDFVQHFCHISALVSLSAMGDRS